MADTPNTQVLGQVATLHDRTTELYGAVARAGQLAVKGTVDVDRAIRAQLMGNARATAQHWRSIMSAKDLRTVGEMHKRFLHDSAEKVAQDARDVLDLVHTRTREATEPFSLIPD